MTLERIGVVSRLDGRHDLVAETLGLRPSEARLVADVLYVNRPLGDTRVRTRTGASIVAFLSGKQLDASPGPEFVFRADDFFAGDVVVAVGHDDGLAKLRDLLIPTC